MKTVNRYKDILKEWFYLDDEGNVRRAKDGYCGRYKKDDIVSPFKLCSHGYGGVHIPRTRTSVPYHHLVAILRGIKIIDDLVIDHINGDWSDNSTQNIRLTTQQLNCRNKRKMKNNTSGVTGITLCGGLYVVRKQLNGERKYLGCRKTLKEAVELLESYKDDIKKNGYTKRHGK